VNITARDETSTLRHRVPGCAVCGAELHRAGTGRRRRYCGGACRQRAWRLRDEARHQRGALSPEADPRDVTRLLAAVLRTARGR
jgi:hypothetical protein